MKKVILFFSFIVIVCLFEGRIRQDNTSYYLNYIFGQSSVYSLYAKDDYSSNPSIVSNKEKFLYSYNPPKAYLGICVVSIITFFVISKKYELSYDDLT